MTTPFLEKIYRLIGDFQRLWKFLLSNMQKLKIDPKGIEDVFISHLHWDHTGGLPSFLQMNNEVKLWVPSYFPEAKHAREVIEVKKPTKLYEGIYSTGELDGIEQSLCKDMIIQTGAKFVEVSAPRRISDYIYTTGELYGPPEEQSLIIDSKKGLVVITGCAHSGIVNIVKRAKELMKRDKVYLVFRRLSPSSSILC